MATTTATVSGPIQPHRVIIGRTASGTGEASVFVGFSPSVVLAMLPGAPNAFSWAESSTTSGLVKITGRSTSTAGIVDFLIG